MFAYFASPVALIAGFALIFVPRSFLMDWLNRGHRHRARTRRRPSRLPSGLQFSLRDVFSNPANWIDLVRAALGAYLISRHAFDPAAVGLTGVMRGASNAAVFCSLGTLALLVNMFRSVDGNRRLVLPTFFLVGWSLGIVTNHAQLPYMVGFTLLGLLACRPLIEGPYSFLACYFAAFSVVGVVFLSLFGSNFVLWQNLIYCATPAVLAAILRAKLDFETRDGRFIPG